MFELNGKGSSIATKIDQTGDNIDSYLCTTRVMESSKHWMSLKLMKGEGHGIDMNIYFGLVRDGAAWDEFHGTEYSTDGWYMSSYEGSLWGNGKEEADHVGSIYAEGQIVSMEADLDKGTLRFWVDGKPQGPGWDSGVTGRLRWAMSSQCNDAVQIVPTPELQPWTPWMPLERDEYDEEEQRCAYCGCDCGGQ
jgi:hypothetical protein